MAKQEKSAAEIYREERKARLAKAAKKSQRKSISSATSQKIGKAIAILLVIALIGGIAGFAVNQSGVIQRSRTAFTVGDVEVSQPEYAYYYISTYNQVVNYVQQYSYYYGLSFDFDSSVLPEEQEYSGDFGDIEGFPEDQTPTWADYLDYSAKTQLQQVKALVKEADARGITLDEKNQAEVQSTLDELEQSAINAASSDGSSRFSLSAYLRYCFGKGVSKSLFTKILEEQQLAVMVQEAVEEEYKEGYTAKQINKEYNANIESYAVVNLRAYNFAAEKVTTGEGDEETTEVTEKTMAAAKKLAESFAEKATSEDAFKTLASQAAKDDGDKDYKDYLTDDTLTLKEDVSYSTLSSTDYDLADWAFSKDTKVLDTYVVEKEDSGYTVYMLTEAMHKAPDTVTYDSRHILINFTETEADEDETDAEAADTKADEAEAAEQEAVETLDTSKYDNVYLKVNGETAKDKEAYKKAQDILEKYLNGDRTEDAFAKLAEENSEDPGSSSNGGLYEGTQAGDFVAPYEQWCLEEGRKEGDVCIVEVESTNYSGYHIIYFVGKGEVTWEEDVKEALAHEDLEVYIEEAAHSEDVAIENVSETVAVKVADTLGDLIKRMNRYSSNNDSYAY